MISVGQAVGYLLLDTTGFSEGFNKAIKDLRAFQNESSTLGDKTAALGSAFTNVGKTLTKNVSVPIAGVGTLMVKTASQFEASMSRAQAISGATGDEFNALRNKAMELGASTVFSAVEVADGMTEMAKAGWNSQQIMDGMAGVLNAASASGEELASVSTIVADAITGFGLEAKDATRVADLLTQAANAGTIDIMDLGESFKYIAPIAQTMGFSIEDVTTAISAMSTAGIKGSQAGTSLRTMFTRLVKPTDQVAKAMDELGIVLTNEDGSFKSLNQILAEMRVMFSGMTDEQKTYYATVLSGQEGMSGLLSILNLTQEEYDAMAESMENAGGTAAETSETMVGNLSGQLTIMKSALEGVAISFGSIMLPLITNFVTKLQDLLTWLNNLSDAQKQAIVTIGEVVVILGPALLIVGKLLKAVAGIPKKIAEIKTAITTLKAVFSVLKPALAALTSPVGLIIAGVTALVAIFIHLWNTSEGFRNFWINLWEGIKNTFNSVVEWFSTAVSNISAWFEALPGRIQAVFQSIGDWFSGVWDSITTWFTELPGKVWGWLTNTAQSIINWLTALPETVAYWLGYLVGNIVQWGVNLYESIVQWGTETYESISNWVTTTIQDIVTWISELPGRVWNWLVETYNRIKQWGTDTYASIKGWVINTLNSVSTWISELPGRVWNWLLSTIEKIRQWGSDTYNSARQIISNFIDRISTGLSELPGKFREWFSEAIDYLSTLPDKLWQIGKDIFNGLWDGLKSIWRDIKAWIEGVKEKITSIFSSAKSGYKDATAAASSTRYGRSGGSYASGLDYVPRDMYVKVHEGERILTKQESKNQITNQPRQQTTKQPVNVIMQVDGRTLGYVTIDNINNITETDGTVKLKV